MVKVYTLKNQLRALCVLFSPAKTGAANLYTRKELKTNELPKIINIYFLMEDFTFYFVYIELGNFFLACSSLVACWLIKGRLIGRRDYLIKY